MANRFARELRKQLTPQEVKLWLKLRELKQCGFHFRRQAPVGHYIVDFAAFRNCLIIEVDGGQHNLARGASEYAARDAFMHGEGFRVLRFWNFEVDRNLDGVMHVIWDVLHDPHPTGLRCASPGHPPHARAGEG